MLANSLDKEIFYGMTHMYEPNQCTPEKTTFLTMFWHTHGPAAPSRVAHLSLYWNNPVLKLSTRILSGTYANQLMGLALNELTHAYNASPI
jgi:hypothetical protein